MSNIYIQEPPTNGKVLLKTTVGDIDIELWSKEAPKACRNFVQLCMEGYYDGTIFHRIIKGFIGQGGDPEGDGSGGESIYGKPFKDEFHSRLRFVRRGLVAMANSGKDDNESQFFFTFGATPELQNKNTVFGQVTGNTIYNMLKLEDCLVDQDDRPIYPPKISTTEVLLNPFSDIIPRQLKEKSEKPSDKPKEKIKKNFTLLSFGDEAEEDEAQIESVSEVYKSDSKSSHDLTDDPKLSSVPAVHIQDTSAERENSDALDILRKKLKKASEEKSHLPKVDAIELERKKEFDKSLEARENTKRQIKELRKELKKKKKTEEKIPEINVEENPEKEENSVLEGYHIQLEKYKEKSEKIFQKGTAEREEQTLKLLKKFQSKLNAAKDSQPDDKYDDTTTLSEDDIDKDTSWMTHQFKAEEQSVVIAKDANMPAPDRYDITDPRNPINQRRRKEKR